MFFLAAHRMALPLAVFVTCVATATAQQRQWIDTSGKYSVEAELVEATQGRVVLKKTNGKLITVPVKRLSETDRRYLQVLAQTVTNMRGPPSPEVIAAWEKAGAEYGWVSQIERVSFGRPGALQWGRKEPVAGGVPAFRINLSPTGKLSVLPPPKVPFGLVLSSHTRAELKELAGLTQLQTLILGSTKVTDAGMKELAGLTQLQNLSLDGTKVTDRGLKKLAGLTQLQTLFLDGTKVTDRGMKDLAGLTQLQNLSLSFTQVTDAGLKELAGMTQLQMLSLFDTQVTDAGLKELAGLTQLQTLGLGSKKVTDAGLKELAGLTQLQNLYLIAPVTDAGLKELARLTQLQTLSLAFSKVTDEGVKKLQQSLPNCDIRH